MDQITEKWIRGPVDEEAVKEGCRFDLARAERVRTFFRKFLRHSKGEWGGKPFELLDWQWQDVIAPLFGWVRPDGTRRYRKAYVEIPKKNGKSTLASGIGLYLLCGDGEHGAEVYSAATARDQASIVHGEAIRMVKASALSSRLGIHETTKTISFAEMNSVYRALASEAATTEGLNANGIIVDELHVWKGRALWDALRYAGRARRQPLLFVITTAGDDMLSVCREQHDYAELVSNGQVLDTRFFAYIRAADPADDWLDPATWRKANPSFGITIKEDDFAAEVKEAEKTPTSQASFKRYSLNLWSSGVNPWLRSSDWAACRQEFDADSLKGQDCYAGLDLAKTSDTTALVLVFPLVNGLFRLLPFFWLPEGTIGNPDRPEHYRQWAKAGFLETTPGDVCDYSFIKARIGELQDKFRILEMAFDPYNAEQVTQEIESEFGLARFSFGQTVGNFAEPTKEFERLVISKKLSHNGHPVLSWQAGNVNVKTDANGNLRPVKPPFGDERKIDGMVAAIMGLARAMKYVESDVGVEVW